VGLSLLSNRVRDVSCPALDAMQFGTVQMPVGKVYVVDDDDDFLKAIERLLCTLGLEVRTFPSAEVFLAEADLASAAGLILDIHIPGISGIELLNGLARSGAEIPVILVTGADSEPTRLAATAAGCSAYLEKPFSAKVLMEAITDSFWPDSKHAG
jgi:FixJ family two-component response regulator